MVQDSARLYRGLVAAARTFDWVKAEPAMHHRESRGVDSASLWPAEKQESLRISFASGAVFHLQIRLERNSGGRDRVFIFGRRIKGLDYATPNHQRASFNSDHRDERGYWLRPNLGANEKLRLASLLPSGAFPQWDGKHVVLGTEEPYVILRRFLKALAVIEVVKGAWSDSCELPFDTAEGETEFEADDLKSISVEEGVLNKFTAMRRSRSQRLRGEAREHFRRQSSDGRLRCAVCDWASPVPTEREVVQIHHVEQLGNYPREGKRLALAEALSRLAPLCPNCHSVVEARPGGGAYTLTELREKMIARSR